jgi:hypothetical protein
MQRPACDDRIETRRVGEFLERDHLKDRTLGGGRVDRDNLVAQIIQRFGEPAIAASDFEYAGRHTGQMGTDEFEDVHRQA